MSDRTMELVSSTVCVETVLFESHVSCPQCGSAQTRHPHPHKETPVAVRMGPSFVVLLVPGKKPVVSPMSNVIDLKLLTEVPEGVDVHGAGNAQEKPTKK